MRTTVRTLVQPLGVRALLALFLAGGFGLRVVAFPAAWGCLTAAPAAHHSGHSHNHQQGHRHHAPDMPACVCIAHVSPASLTPQPLELAAPSVRPSQVRVVTRLDQLPLITAPTHLRPFPIGPPAVAIG